jgi:hypothetical protein
MGSAVTESEAGNLVVSAAGAITMGANNLFNSTSAVELSAGTTIALGGVTSSAGSVWISATGAVSDAGNGTYAENITAANLVLDGGAGVGVSGTPIQTAATTFTATGGSGGVYIKQTGASSVGPVSFPVLSVIANSTTTSATITQNGVATNGSGGGAVSLTTTAGLTVNGNLTSPAGVTVSSGGAVQENFAIVDTGALAITASTSVTMASAASITASSASLVSSGNISVSTVNTGTGAITINSGAAVINVLGSSGGTNLTGGVGSITSVGSQGTLSDTLNTALTSLASSSTGTGSIVIAQTGPLTLTSATTANGFIQVIASGNLTATSVSGTGTGSTGVTLSATSGNLVVGSVTSDGPVIANASAQVQQLTSETGTANITGTSVAFTAGTGIGVSSPVVVSTPLLSASSTNGNIQITNLVSGAVSVSNLSTGTGNIVYSQAGGPANITSATTTSGNITLTVGSGALNVGTVTAGSPGNISLNVTGTGTVQVTTPSAPGGTLTISTGGSVSLTQNITTSGTPVNLTGAVVLTMDTTISTSGGAVTSSGTINGAYALTINSGAGSVNLQQAVGTTTALTGLTINSSSTATLGKAVTVTGNISLSSSGVTLGGGAGSVTSTGGGTFTDLAPGTGNTIGLGTVPSSNTYSSTFTAADVTALAAGFSLITIGSSTNTARVDVGSGVSFTSPALIQSGTAVQVLAGDTLAITGSNALTLLGGAGDTGQVVMQAGSGIASGSGTVTLQADELNLASSGGSITGTGTLVLEPLTLARPIVVGQAGASGQFALTLAELAVPASTLNLVIGNTLGTGSINVYAVSFANPVTFLAEGSTGSLAFNGNVSTTLANESISANIGGSITISGNITDAVSGSINLVAAYGGSGSGNIVIAPTANELLSAVSGNIALSAQNMTFGTFSLWTQLIASGSVNLTLGATGGTLLINDIYSEIKANSNITIATSSATPSATGQIELEGQIQAVGTITVTSNNTINLGNATVVSKGNITMSANAGIQLSAGIINSQSGTVTITADSNNASTGTLAVGGISPILINSSGTATLSGESVAVGNAVAFARVLSSAGLNITSNFNTAGNGTVTFGNASDQMLITGAIQIGQSNFGAGTPYSVTFTGGALSSSTSSFSLYALNAVTVASTSITVTTTFLMSSNDNITINTGDVFTAGGALTLLADASTGMNGVLTLVANPSTTQPVIYDPNGTVTLEGFTVSNNAVITAAHIVTTTGH